MILSKPSIYIHKKERSVDSSSCEIAVIAPKEDLVHPGPLGHLGCRPRSGRQGYWWCSTYEIEVRLEVYDFFSGGEALTVILPAGAGASTHAFIQLTVASSPDAS